MTPSNNELLALIKMKIMLKRGNPPMTTFLFWLHERLLQIHKEDRNVD